MHEQRRTGWANGKQVDEWISTLRGYAFSHLVLTPVANIGTPEALKVLSPIWLEKRETARRVRQRIATVLEWARGAGERRRRPVLQLDAALAVRVSNFSPRAPGS